MKASALSGRFSDHRDRQTYDRGHLVPSHIRVMIIRRL